MYDIIISIRTNTIIISISASFFLKFKSYHIRFKHSRHCYSRWESFIPHVPQSGKPWEPEWFELAYARALHLKGSTCRRLCPSSNPISHYRFMQARNKCSVTSQKDKTSCRAEPLHLFINASQMFWSFVKLVFRGFFSSDFLFTSRPSGGLVCELHEEDEVCLQFDLTEFSYTSHS